MRIALLMSLFSVVTFADNLNPEAKRKIADCFNTLSGFTTPSASTDRPYLFNSGYFRIMVKDGSTEEPQTQYATTSLGVFDPKTNETSVLYCTRETVYIGSRTPSIVECDTLRCQTPTDRSFITTRGGGDRLIQNQVLNYAISCQRPGTQTNVCYGVSLRGTEGKSFGSIQFGPVEGSSYQDPPSPNGGFQNGTSTKANTVGKTFQNEDELSAVFSAPIAELIKQIANEQNKTGMAEVSLRCNDLPLGAEYTEAMKLLKSKTQPAGGTTKPITEPETGSIR